MGWVVNVTPRPLYFPECAPVPIVGEAGWAPGSVWKGTEKRTPHAPNEVCTPGLPIRGRSLSRPPYGIEEQQTTHADSYFLRHPGSKERICKKNCFVQSHRCSRGAKCETWEGRLRKATKYLCDLSCAALMYHLCSIAMILKYRSGTVEFTQTLSQAVFAPAIRNARRATLITRQEWLFTLECFGWAPFVKC